MKIDIEIFHKTLHKCQINELANYINRNFMSAELKIFFFALNENDRKMPRTLSNKRSNNNNRNKGIFPQSFRQIGSKLDRKRIFDRFNFLKGKCGKLWFGAKSSHPRPSVLEVNWHSSLMNSLGGGGGIKH